MPGLSQERLPGLLVRNRNFVLLWAAYGIAAVGDHLSEMALLKERGGLDRTDATRVQALITFGFFLPFVVLGPLAGWWSDRFSRKWTMVAADVLRAIVVFNLALVVSQLERWLEPAATGGGREFTALGDFAIVIPLALVGALAAFFSPSRQAMLPTLIRDDQLVRANAMISALGTIGAITAGVLGGLLVDTVGFEWNYRINTFTFLASAVLVGGIFMSQTRAVPHEPPAGVLAPLVAGFRYVRTHRRILQMILLGSVFWACAGVVISVVPAIVRDIFGGSLTEVGIYRGLLVVGLALGAAVMSVIGPAMPTKLAVLLALAACSFWVLALDLSVWQQLGRIPTAVCLVGIGAGGAALLVTVMATIQRFVPDSRRGRVCGVSDMCTMAAMVAATGALGLPSIPQLDQYTPWLLLAVAGVLLASLGLAWRRYSRTFPSDGWTSFLWLILRCYASFWFRVKRDGPCTIPQTGPVIVASNHTCGIDPIIILATSPHRLVGFLVNERDFRKRVPHYFMRRVGCVPIDRDNPGKAFVRGCVEMLHRGGVLGIFPQGTFQAPGEPPLEAKVGVAMLALRTGATLVPVHISGTSYHRSWGVAYLQRHRARIRYGKPIDLSRWHGRERDRQAHRELTDVIMARIESLASPLPGFPVVNDAPPEATACPDAATTARQ
jgi:1-acyl-sn-glycerol-3-phosphate acyltransferase